MSDESLDLWIDRLNQGDEAAVGHVLEAYEPYLRIAVRQRLGRRLRAKVDSADVVQSVFADVLRGMRGGAWRFDGRAQLMAFLKRVAWRRLADRYQEHRTSLDREQPIAALEADPLPLLADPNTPRPSEVAQGHEFWERVLGSCPPSHREVVRLRASGHRMAEIAEKTGLHEGSVRRILYDLARRMAVTRRAIGRNDDERDLSSEVEASPGT